MRELSKQEIKRVAGGESSPPTKIFRPITSPGINAQGMTAAEIFGFGIYVDSYR